MRRAAPSEGARGPGAARPYDLREHVLHLHAIAAAAEAPASDWPSERTARRERPSGLAAVRFSSSPSAASGSSASTPGIVVRAREVRAPATAPVPTARLLCAELAEKDLVDLNSVVGVNTASGAGVSVSTADVAGSGCA